MLPQGLACTVAVQGIVAKAVNVFGLVRTSVAKASASAAGLPAAAAAAPGYGYQRVKGEQRGNEVILFDELTLLITLLFGDHAVATEADPLHESTNASLLLIACLERRRSSTLER